MNKKYFTLLILAAGCSETAFYPMTSENELLIDYSIKYAFSEGCRNVVAVVPEADREIAWNYMEIVRRKYNITNYVAAVHEDFKFSASQLTDAWNEIGDDDIITVFADTYYGKEMFAAAAEHILKQNRSCMIGTVPEQKLPSIEENDTGIYSTGSVMNDHRICKNMFGLTYDTRKLMEDEYDEMMTFQDRDSTETNITFSEYLKNKIDILSNFSPDLIDKDKEFFTVYDKEDARYVYSRNGEMKKNISESCCCSFAKIYLYTTAHNTIAVNFDAYAKTEYPFGQDYMHFSLNKPFDTNISASEISGNTSCIIDSEYNWNSNMNYENQYCAGKCSSSLKIKSENNTIHYKFQSEWNEINPWEKYPIHLEMKFKYSAYPEFLRILSDDQLSETPMLVLKPVFYKKAKETSDTDKTDPISDTQTSAKKVTPPDISVQGNSVKIDIKKDLSSGTQREYADVFDISEESKIINYDLLAHFGKFSDSGPGLILKKGLDDLFSREKKLIYFAYSAEFDLSENVLKVYSTEMMDQSALEPKCFKNNPPGKLIDICKMYCRIEKGKIKGHVKHFNDGNHSEFCGPFRMFQAMDKNGEILAAVVITKESDFSEFIETAKKQTIALKTKVIVFEIMKRYQ